MLLSFRVHNTFVTHSTFIFLDFVSSSINCRHVSIYKGSCNTTSVWTYINSKSFSVFFLDRLTLFSKRSWRLRPCLTQFSITLCSLYTLQSSNRNILNTLNPANGLRGKVKHVCHIVWMTRVQHQTLHKWWPSAFKRTVCSLCWTSSLCKCHISNALWLE